MTAKPESKGEENIAEFERFSAVILAKLYEEFPVPLELIPSEIDPDPSNDLREFHAGTIEFLESEGYLRYGDVHKHNDRGRSIGIIYYDAVLTAKGLAALNAGQGVTATSDGGTNGKRLMEALRSGAMDIAKAIVREVLNASVKQVLS